MVQRFTHTAHREGIPAAGGGAGDITRNGLTEGNLRPRLRVNAQCPGVEYLRLALAMGCGAVDEGGEERDPAADFPFV